MMTYDAYLEVWPDGTVHAHIPELPGCYAKGTNEAQSLAYLRIVVPDYYRWLSMQDDETPTMSGDVEVHVRERVPVTRNALHEIRAFFTTDAQPLSEDDLDWGLALMSYVHQDFVKQLAGLDDAALDWQPTPDDWSIRQVAEHVAQSDAWLARRLDDQPNVPLVSALPGTLRERLDSMHERTLLRLSEMPPEMRSIVKERNGERWSMRKIIRRAISHEREHTEGIAILRAQYIARP